MALAGENVSHMPHDETLLEELERETRDPDKIVQHAPSERFMLGYLDTSCLVINRMVGTGIFNTPQSAMAGTNSTGMTLLFWFLGFINTVAGYHVYLEYGLNVPRYVVDGVEQSVPRSGGDLNYLQYVYRKPRYRKDTVLFFTVLFGIAFICVGNTAGNSINFALRVLQAAHPDAPIDSFPQSTVYGLAFATATFACFVHTFSRRGGIWLSNLFAIVKVGILLLIIFTAAASADGDYHNSDGSVVPNLIDENTNRRFSFEDASGDPNGYARAFLGIIFAYSGFEQPNYVLGEIRRPRRTYPIAFGAGITIVSLLYIAVNIAYMVIVPKEIQERKNVAQEFFIRTFGTYENPQTAIRIFNSFLAVSTLGNIIVMTYTAARVKQEIAKEGFLGSIWLNKFFARNLDLSFGRLLGWLRKNGMFNSLLKYKWLRPEEHTEKTPVGALVLHLLSCVVSIFATLGMPSNEAYNLLTGLLSYLIFACFGVLLSAGIIILRFWGPPKTQPVMTYRHPGRPDQQPVQKSWTEMTGPSIKPSISILCAVIYLVGNLFPVVCNWVPLPATSTFNNPNVRWYVLPTICWALLGFGALWYLGFIIITKRKERHNYEHFVVTRHPEFAWDEKVEQDTSPNEGAEGSDRSEKQGSLVLVREIVDLSWKGRDFDEVELTQQAHKHQRPGRHDHELEGTDFADMI